MELQVVGTEGIPEGCVLSVRAGATRRQAPVSADRPFRFPTTIAEAVPFKVDVLEPVASARLILRPGEERQRECMYNIPLEPAPTFTDEGRQLSSANKAAISSVTISVKPSDDSRPPTRMGEDGERVTESERPDSEARKRTSGSAASSRHGQANAAREYLDQHNLVEFTQLLVQSVIKEQPDQPYAFMAKQFFFPEPLP